MYCSTEKYLVHNKDRKNTEKYMDKGDASYKGIESGVSLIF